MGYRSLRECVDDLERNGHLVRYEREVDPYLEMAEIQRRLYRAQGPAILFERVKGSPFPAVSNLFGTFERAKFLFRDTIEHVRRIVQVKADPANSWRRPGTVLWGPITAAKALPSKVRRGPGLTHTTTIDQLPQIQSWPDDGGPFVTLPAVYTEDPDRPGIFGSNLGMYRVQLGGNDYRPNEEIGLHYQIHRGIGVHHSKAGKRGEPLRVSIFVGGPPALAFAAVLPLPEGLSELLFAGMLGGRRFRYARTDGHLVAADADFTIVGTIDPRATKPEGPFGDHLGYYSLVHDFPVMKVERVYHRPGAIWPFTVVGRPPQEDTSFGKLIHDITAPMIPKEIPGVRAVHAVDAAGVHPLLLAIGSERYVPYEDRIPREILTQSNAILGFGQCSLAKYLLIVAGEDAPDLDIDDLPAFFRHLLERFDPERDLHFQTRTTMDTLDYSGTGLNTGSKLVIAAAGKPRRELAAQPPAGLDELLPESFGPVSVPLPGILAVQAPSYGDPASGTREAERFAEALEPLRDRLKGFPLLVLVDDAEFCGAALENFLWATFTRSNPSHDVHGVGASVEHKHWGCPGPVVIDARIKPHHAPPLVEDPAVTEHVDKLAAPGGPLHGVIGEA